jgi:MoaA/NifB/PqqE/SkfB family radical SAM enzyme
MKPILCNYYITYRCNARCSFCDFWKKKNYQETADCSLEDVAHNLPQLKKIGVKFIDFTGGEPLLHSQLPEMLKLAKRYRFYTSVTTNCLLYPQRAEELKGLINLLHFSLDSMEEEENDRLRGRGSFASVMESIEAAKSLGEHPDLLFTATQTNYKAIGELIRFAQEQKLILIVNPVFKYSDQASLTKEALNYLDQFKKETYVYINKALHFLIREAGNKRQRPRCRAISSSIVISPQNELLLPCFHQQQLAIPIRSNIKQILHSQTYKLLKKQQGTFPFCNGCTINCYFDPSFLYKLDRFFWLSVISKFKYGFDKFIR